MALTKINFVNQKNAGTFAGKRLRLRTAVANVGSKGDSVEITGVSSIASTTAYFNFRHTDNLGYGPFCLAYSSFDALEENREQLAAIKEDIAKQKAELDRQSQMVDSKMAFLAETGETEVDDKTFELYHVMKTLEKDMTPLEKAKMIRKVLN